MKQNDDDEILAEINITPLVDIMLVLLIMFMLVSSLVDFSAIKVELPKAATAENAKNESIAIIIAKSGEYYLSGDPVISFDELKQAVADKKRQNPDVQAVISADTNVSHGHVIKVIDMIRESDISKFAISVELPENEIK